MLYEPKTLKIFMQNYQEALRTSERLKLSFKRLKSSFPLQKKDLVAPSDDLSDRLDAFRVRYSDLQDCIGNKLFRGILLLEEEQALNMLDMTLI